MQGRGRLVRTERSQCGFNRERSETAQAERHTQNHEVKTQEDRLTCGKPHCPEDTALLWKAPGPDTAGLLASYPR